MGQLKVGFVTLAGRTNSGKSTLINQIMKTEIAIATYKPQTTRHLIKGVYQDKDSQIVFVDSPGMHQAVDELGQSMQKAASVAVQETDLTVLVVDARKNQSIGTIEKRIIKLATTSDIPLLLAINKIDLIDKINLLPLIKMYTDYANFRAVVPISAKNDDGIDSLLAEIKTHLPEGTPLLPDDQYTDQTEKQLAAEYIREEIIYQIEDEIPYSVAVKIEDFAEIYDQAGERIRVKIHAAIYCERESHKRILLGKKGQKIASIGKKSRQKIATMTDCPCDLMLFIKVRENWRNHFEQLKELGYSSRDIH